MPNNPKLSNAGANTKVDAITAQLNNGFLRIYDGTQPASADTAVGAQTLLAELRFNATAFAAAVAGVAAANAFTGDLSANATGTASWCRALKSDGTTVIFDGAVGVSGSDLNLNTVSVVLGATVDVTAFQYTQPKG